MKAIVKNKRENDRSFGFLSIGLALAGIGLGIAFSNSLFRIQQFIFLIAFLFVLVYIGESLTAHFKKQRIGKWISENSEVSVRAQQEIAAKNDATE